MEHLFALMQYKHRDSIRNCFGCERPLPGANVVVKGTTNGTQTDFDGNYTLNNVASDATLVFSYIGFLNKEVPVNGQANISVVL